MLLGEMCFEMGSMLVERVEQGEVGRFRQGCCGWLLKPLGQHWVDHSLLC